MYKKIFVIAVEYQKNMCILFYRGLSPATCEKIYIDTARYLDSYGMQPFTATWVSFIFGFV
jgi:hypothetical protein